MKTLFIMLLAAVSAFSVELSQADLDKLDKRDLIEIIEQQNKSLQWYQKLADEYKAAYYELMLKRFSDTSVK